MLRLRPLPAAAAAAFAAALLAGGWGGARPADAQVRGEYEVKAAFLFHFTRFVEWPVEAFESASVPFRLCVVGRDPFDGALATIVAGERVAGRRLTVEGHAGPETAGDCQIVFLAATEDPATLADLPAAGARHRLIVGESERSLRHGGHFRFRVESDRVRLGVNLAAIEESRLRVSSKLLRLAEVERPGRS